MLHKIMASFGRFDLCITGGVETLQMAGSEAAFLDEPVMIKGVRRRREPVRFATACELITLREESATPRSVGQCGALALAGEGIEEA